MNEQHWAEFASELETAFKGELPPITERVYAAHLGDLDYDVARAGLSLLVQRGQTFLPSPGEVVGAARAVTADDDPAWYEAWASIERAMSRYPDRKAVLREAERGGGAAVAAFLRQYGVDRLWREPVNDPDVGGAVVARIGKCYDEHRERATERERRDVAIASAERDALAAGRPALRRPALAAGGAA